MNPGNGRRKQALTGMALMVGFGLVGVAVFAYPLGLALDPEWGGGQTLLLGVGLIILACAVGLWFQQSLSAAAQRLGPRAREIASQVWQWPVRQRLASQLGAWIDSRLAQEWVFQPARRGMRATASSRIVVFVRQHPSVQLTALTLLAIVLVQVIYVWFVSVGFWTDWPGSTDYYDRLGVSFRHGKVYLEYRPDPALISLADPYDPAQRGDIPVLWDLTLFKGRYYLYWGPVPALIVAGVRQITLRQVGDAELVFGFVTGSFLFSVLILLHLRRRFYKHLPVWSFILAVFAAGLAYPMLWLLSRPAVYEAAIASGQFFLLGGLLAGMKAFDAPEPVPWRLALAGAFWAGAIGSRTSLGLGIACLVSVAVLRLLLWAKRTRRFRQTLVCLASLGGPLALGAAGLGWYNWARFGSVLDFGHRYQITGMNLNLNYAHVFSIANVLPNLHNYLLNPLSRLELFPFIKPQWGLHGMLLRLHIPKLFYSEQVTGLLPAAPFLLLALLPAAWLGRVWRRGMPAAGTQPDKMGQAAPAELVWSVIYLAGGAAFIFAADLGYVVSSMRYLADVVPCLAMLACLGLWQGYAALENTPFWRRIFSVASTSLAVYSIVVALLLAVTGYLARFENLNPALFDSLTSWFTW